MQLKIIQKKNQNLNLFWLIKSNYFHYNYYCFLNFLNYTKKNEIQATYKANAAQKKVNSIEKKKIKLCQTQ
jgi:hypothetical protein